jgi:DNA invertase Pin-like site-specific DNA recombinase
MRAVIYARYSSDLQREASIEDQVRLCKERIKREGWQLLFTYVDKAMSGASHLRPGYQKLLEDARRGEFDVVVAEALDRLSRDQEHVAALFKQLSFSGVRIVTLAEGEISELHVGLKGTMNALFLKDLASKIRRGQRGRISAGRSPGGLPYGYDVVRQFGPDGRPDNGLRTVNERQAAIVRRIFDNYASGMSARQIAKALNSEGLPSPRGGLWNASSITGNRARRDGILWNEAYLGRLIYNRQRFLKDPITAKRVPRLNPQKDWVVINMPDLRIVSQEIWSEVHHRLGTRRTLPLRDRRGPRRLLSGMLQCGICGGPITIIGEGRLGCSGHKERGTCSNNKKISATRVEEAVLQGIKAQMLQPELIREFANAYNEAVAQSLRHLADNRVTHERQLSETEKQITRILDSMQAAGPLPSLVERLKQLESTKAQLSAAMPSDDTLPPCATFSKSNQELAELYRQKVDKLHESLTADEPTRVQAANELRALIKKVEVHPLESKGAARLKVTGEMAAVIGLTGRGRKTAVQVVAEERCGQYHNFAPVRVSI